MLPRVAALLADILGAAALIERVVAGVSIEAYRESVELRSIVERQFIIIGEAVRRMEALDPQSFSQVPKGRGLVDFRNVLVHGYASIDDEVVWEAATLELPRWIQEIRTLAEAGPPPIPS